MDHVSIKIDVLLKEGAVARARTHMLRTLKDKSTRIQNFIKKIGLTSEVTDMYDNSVYIVEAQFGKTKLFSKSQVVSIYIHDADDFVVYLPMALAIYVDKPNHNKFKSINQVKNFLLDIKNEL